MLGFPSARRWWRGATAGLLLLCLLVGCSSGKKRKPCYKTTGQVLVGGKPYAGIVVVLAGKDEDSHDDAEPVRSSGTTDEKGEFTLTTYEAGDGAPAGDYRVLLIYEPAASPFGANKPHGPAPKIDLKYFKPETSPFEARVEAQPENRLPTIKLP